MKKILLHAATIDSAGGYQDAGAVLTIGDNAAADTISAERAKELIDSDCASPVPTSNRDPLDHDGDGRKGGSVKTSS